MPERSQENLWPRPDIMSEHPVRRFNPTNESGYNRRSTDAAAQLEIYKFAVPLLISMVGVLLYFELSSINASIHSTNNKIDNLSGNMATITEQMVDVQRNTGYDRQRIDKLEDGRHAK